MANMNFSQKRQIYDAEDTENKKTVASKNGGVKTKKKPKSEGSFGSGSTKKAENGIKKSKEIEIPDIKELEKYILQFIIGQDNQVRKIITSIYKAKKFKTLRSNILIIGKSGTGKTETIKQIAEKLNIPYTIEDATKYTQEGYYGADAIDVIYNLIENCDYNIEKAQQGIIVFDEIDKKVGHEQHDVAGVEVLKSLLKIIEGTKIKIELDPFGAELYDFDTKNIIFIFLGAFSGLEKIREKRLNTNPLGFSVDNTEKKEKQKSRYLKKDLVEYGMPEEFVGRIDTIIEMNELSKEDLASILKKSKLSIFRRYQAELRKQGITLSYDGKLFELIAEESLSLDTGARELSNTVNYIFENITYDVLSNPKKYHKCILDLDIVKDNTKYELL